MKFEDYHIAVEIKKNLVQNGFKRPTDIQFKSIPYILNGEDVLAIAQTGTGKTAAFAIPIIHQIHKKKYRTRFTGIQCIIMVPTRELAMQIEGVFNQLAKHTKVNVLAIHGGVEQDPQIQRLQFGIDVLIATPGRMFDLISQGYIQLKHVKILVLDEADHMLDLGFIQDIQNIKKMLTHKHQTLFFSATINKKIKKLAFSQVKSNAIRIQVSPEDPVAKNVSHFVMNVQMDDKRFFLEKFIQEHRKSKIIVFVRTRVRAERVAKAMLKKGIKSETIHGDKLQRDRSDVMNQFKSGHARLLIATDVSARGIDIPNVDYVINYDLPDKPENYVHRVGRTGRSNQHGIAISFCSDGEKDLLESIQHFINKPVQEIKINKKDYLEVVSQPDQSDDLQSLLQEYALWQNKERKRKKK